MWISKWEWLLSLAQDLFDKSLGERCDIDVTERLERVEGLPGAVLGAGCQKGQEMNSGQLNVGRVARDAAKGVQSVADFARYRKERRAVGRDLRKGRTKRACERQARASEAASKRPAPPSLISVSQESRKTTGFSTIKDVPPLTIATGGSLNMVPEAQLSSHLKHPERGIADSLLMGPESASATSSNAGCSSMSRRSSDSDMSFHYGGATETDGASIKAAIKRSLVSTALIPQDVSGNTYFKLLD
ncbi:hypothetical protein QFC20_005529 [Naganishia adeliensis]|uniref:Uncharacterized protein n=1 Tax=Naganishia adeliensis TaxID=92952 RepID=A0ACC2VL69_9TREE|nr:hypothetical protein QFC20_005529 [Naganishia adeliensis]